MPRAINSLSSHNKFAKRHYEAIALAMQEARRSVNGSNDPIAGKRSAIFLCSPEERLEWRNYLEKFCIRQSDFCASCPANAKHGDFT
jgi:hypothetical protein